MRIEQTGQNALLLLLQLAVRAALAQGFLDLFHVTLGRIEASQQLAADLVFLLDLLELLANAPLLFGHLL